MRVSGMSSRTLVIFTSVFIVTLFALGSAFSSDARFSIHTDDQGVISCPTDFRESMVHIGSWFVPEGGASGFHDVYTERSSVESYRLTGVFPDGATLVKELRAADQGDFTTGQGISYANTRIKQWFVMIKDSQNRFAGKPQWGDGWGWALFITQAPDDGQPLVNSVTDYKADCLGCHVPARESDWVYSVGYPTLKEQ